MVANELIKLSLSSLSVFLAMLMMLPVFLWIERYSILQILLSLRLNLVHFLV